MAYECPPRESYDCIYLAAADHVDALCAELTARGGHIAGVMERLVFAQGARGPAAWAQNTWLEPVDLPIASIGDAAKRLRAIQRNWCGYPLAWHRRARLIADRLPHIGFRPRNFGEPPPAAALGSWTLVARDRLLASARCSSAFAHGAPAFIEDRRNPPNRAYLKLWEALTLARTRPGAGDRCVDLGAAPGGWTWVLAALGAAVIAVDRAPLAPDVAAHPGVSQRRGDAFGLDPAAVGAVDWICCDVIAYPPRLRALAERWAAAHPRAAMVVTIKYQGAVDATETARFLDIPGSRLCHLAANKHELTWFRLPDGGPVEAAA